MKKVIIIIAVLAIALGAAAYFIFLRGKAADSEAKPSQTPQLYTWAIEDYFVTNVKDSDKLFKISVVLVLNKPGMDEFLEAKQFTIRDALIFMLRDLTEDDISSPDIQDRLRVAIPEKLNKALEIDNIVSAYFNDFVMQ